MPVGTPQLAMIKIDKFLGVRVGDQAPDFFASGLDGEPVTLAALRGKVVLLDFWATWCAPCIAEMPNIKKMLERYGADGQFVVIGISLDDSSGVVSDFVRKRDIPWRQAVLGPAEKNPVAQLYNVSQIPATFLIDRSGKVVATDLQGPALQQKLGELFKSPPIQQAAKTE